MRIKSFFILVLSTTILLSGCNLTEEETTTETMVQEGDQVSIAYTMSWPDGTIFASSEGDDLTTNSFMESKLAEDFEAGDDTFLLGDAVVGSPIAQTVEGSLSHTELGFDTYYDEYRVQKVPLKLFTINNGTEPSVGESYTSNNKKGIVTDVDTDASLVTVDFNPRYTREDINYSFSVNSRQVTQ